MFAEYRRRFGESPDYSIVLADALSSGRALETFARMIDRQGGDARVVEDTSRLPVSSSTRKVTRSRLTRHQRETAY